ncbi:uncharacterized protein LOC121837360, partial [Ixodes scapularis]|uniref:uncharacterized protein LOC121837360 n=1 Tax=Ixodes scapularis TaxID=6945 RepID=UPI001C38BD05
RYTVVGTAKTQEPYRPRCIDECMDVVMRVGTAPATCSKTKLDSIVGYFQQNNLNLIVSDKEGGFIVALHDIYTNKARMAIGKTFKKLEGYKSKSVKARALQLCHTFELEQLRKQITSADKDQLGLFFTGKTHKEACPFRVVITEKGSWQGAMSRFLQRQLATLRLNDPFLVSNSEKVIDYLENNILSVRYGLSLDVEDLFYSIPHEGMFTALREHIEANGEVAFQNNCGMAVDSFLELLRFYLNSTVVTFNKEHYIQKRGICIGSCVAPALTDVYLSKCNRAIDDSLDIPQVSRMFRYVDDYLILLNARPKCETQFMDSVQTTFEEHAGGLKFTHEWPENQSLQFLDLKITFHEDSACWMYAPRTKKSLLQFDSAHTKLVKRGIVASTLGAALRKSCDHTAGESFNNQLQRLRASGYPTSVISTIVESMLKQRQRGSPNRTRIRPVVKPYIHRLSHNLKKVAAKFEVPILLTAPDKLKRLCPKINEQRDTHDLCKINHARKFVECQSGIIYEIPLSCGKVYLGQSGRCINVRLREHALSLNSTPAGHLAVHVRDCGCTPRFPETKVLKHFKDQKTREVYEACKIANKGLACISTPSIALTAKELQFLNFSP